jgi:predicted nucleotide-binding protein
MTDPNSFESLEEFFGYYRSKLPHYEQRRDLVIRMYEQTEASIQLELVKGEKIELSTAAVGVQKAIYVLQEKKSTPNPQKVLVVYGRNEQARAALFAFLRAVGLHPLEWAELVKATGEGSPFIGRILEKGFSEAKLLLFS